MKFHPSLQTLIKGYKELFQLLLILAHMVASLAYCLGMLFIESSSNPPIFDLWYFHVGVWLYVSLLLAIALGQTKNQSNK